MCTTKIDTGLLYLSLPSAYSSEAEQWRPHSCTVCRTLSDNSAMFDHRTCNHRGFVLLVVSPNYMYVHATY